MAASISPSAGTQSVQSSAVNMQIQAPTGSAPATAPTVPRSRAQTTVELLFQLTANLSAQLSGSINSAEANRVQGGEGADPTLMMESLMEMKEKIDAFRARAPSFSQFTDEISAEVDQAIKSGRASGERLQELVDQAQQAMAEKYGYVGNIVNTTA
jgi:hypothetical protein